MKTTPSLCLTLLASLCCSFHMVPRASADLIGYWDFETDYTDQSGEGNDGTPVGNITLDTTTFAAGAQSMKLENADDSYLDINSGAGGMNISDLPSFTVAMWVNSADIQNDKRIFSESSSTNVQPLYNIGTGAGGNNMVDLYRRVPAGGVTNNHDQTLGEPFGDGAWHHVAVVDQELEDGAVGERVVLIYIDGVLDLIEPQFTYIDSDLEVDTTTFGGILRASAEVQACCGFNGNLDDIAVWDQALTAEQIIMLADDEVSPGDLSVTPTDADQDGMRDAYEQQIIDADPNDAISTFADVLPGDDFDMDTSTNANEEIVGTDPTNPDTDDDGANDGSETDTGSWVSVTDRGTDPLNDDTDNDGLKDGVENPDLSYVDAMQSGTDPHVLDTDMDGQPDGSEIGNGSDPTDPNDPAPLPTFALDFNSTSQGGGPNAVGGDYQDYNAAHEVIEDFVRQEFTTLGTVIGVTPSWPDTTDANVQQMIDRGDVNDVQYTGSQVELLTDWIGVDTRTDNGGNGDYDGVNGDPTRIHLTLDGVPGGTYEWISFHHDTENIHTPFIADISLDGGASFENIGSFQMTSSSTGGTPANPNREFGPTPESLSSTVRHSFSTDGASNIVLQFTPLSQTGVHNRFVGINGFNLVQTSSEFSKFAITEVSLDPGDGTPGSDILSITFPTSPGQEFFIEASRDMKAWDDELEDGFPADAVAEETTFTVSPSVRFAGQTKIFLRVRLAVPEG